MMRKPIAFAAQVSVALLLLLAAVVGFAVWHASSVLKSAQRNIRYEREIRFVVRPLVEATDTGFEPVSSPAVFTQVARFQNNLYIAGPAGLLVYQLSGQFVRSYAVGRELPGSILLALAPALLGDSREPELILATAADGLLAFDGR